MESEPCNIDFENPEKSTCILNSNSTSNPDSSFYAQNRQTGEEFRSSAPPDCRLNFVCDSPEDIAQ